MTSVDSAFFYRKFSYIIVIFDPVVAPICHRNLRRQTIYRWIRLDETYLLVELYFEICVLFMELQSFENPCVKS